MINVLITGIGGSIGIDVCRSLRLDEAIHITGTDCDPWCLELGRQMCDDVVELPRADRNPEAFVEVFERTVKERNIDYSFINPDPELQLLADIDWLPPCFNSVPDIELLRIYLDKGKTAAMAGSTGAFPKTVDISSFNEMDGAFAHMPTPLWLRASVGPGGKASIRVDGPEEARSWMRYWRKHGGVDRWVLQEYLPGRNFNWTGIYDEGQLIGAASMERLKYFLGSVPVSGVSGQVSLCATVDPSLFEETVQSVVHSIDEKPDGLYSIDFREDIHGKPLVTEINPRFAGRPWLYTCAGMNLPLAAVRSSMGIVVGDAIAEGGLQLGLHLHRQLDVEPVIGYPRGENRNE